jgi:cytochrome c-type biogenesis protein CcmH
MSLWIWLAAVASALAGAVMLRMLVRRPVAVEQALGHEALAIRSELRQLEQMVRNGALSAARLEERRGDYERRMLDALLRQPDPVEPRPSSWRVAVAAIVFFGAGATAGVLWLDTWATAGDDVRVEAGRTAGDARRDARRPHDHVDVDALTQRLASRLQRQPDDVAGWTMLARAYVALGRYSDAAAAFDRACLLNPDNAQLLADYADALAMANRNDFRGQPLELIEKALRIQPDNLRALAMAGLAAFDRGDYAASIRYWERVVQIAPAGNDLARHVRARLAEARRRAPGNGSA